MVAKFIPLTIDRGMFSSGEPSETPDGYCRAIRNMLLRPNRLDSRPPFVYDSLMSITGLGIFDDQTNKCSRQLSLASDQKLYEKATSGETQSASLGTVTGTRLTDLTNYRGVAYGMMETSGLPVAAFSFDGTNINTSPFNSPIQGRSVVAYLDRIFIIYPRVVITALNDGAAAKYYGDTVAVGNATVRAIVSGSTTLYRAASNAGVTGNLTWANTTVAASTIDQVIRVRWDIRAVDAGHQTPIRLGFVLNAAIAINTAYTVGNLQTNGGYLYMCTTAGTSAAVPPVYGTAFNSQTVDGTVTWTNMGVVDVILRDLTIDTSVANPDWQTIYLSFTLPPHTNVLSGNAQLSWASLTGLYPLDVAFKDGLTDGDARKANHGLQVTAGDFYYPFINKESTGTATVDINAVIWSEILQPKVFRASRNMELPEVVGFPSAGCLSSGRLIVFKRSAFWIFAGNTDTLSLDIIPIRKEDKKEGVGCIGPKALDTIDDDVYFVGEDGIYRFKPGMEAPEELGGDAMREEIISRGSNWVELQSTYNQPILRINKREKEVYVYTQKGTIYVYNIARKGWTAVDVTIDGSKVEVADMIFNPNTRKMEVAFGGYGLARLDWSNAAATDIIDNTATGRSVTTEIVTRPIETFAPRLDWLVDNMGVFHLATASQTGQTLTASVSTDRGATFPWSDTVTLDLTNPRNQIDLFESAPSLTLKLATTGKTGGIVGNASTPSVWSVSKFDAEVEIIGGEWPQSKPAPQSATL